VLGRAFKLNEVIPSFVHLKINIKTRKKDYIYFIILRENNHMSGLTLKAPPLRKERRDSQSVLTHEPVTTFLMPKKRFTICSHP
jgi:hypothetical protein